MLHIRSFSNRIVLVIAVAVPLLYFLAAATPIARAGTQAITRYVSPDGIDQGNCSTSGSRCRTIQYAVNQAGSGDTILVAQGTYTYNSTTDTCTFLQTRSAVCFVDKTLTILGGYSISNWSVANPTVNLTVIDGQNAYRGVAVVGYNNPANARLNLEGFTIQNGRAQGPTFLNPYDPSAFGGGMWVNSASIALKDVVFKNNRAVGANTSWGPGGTASGAGLAITSAPSGSSSLLQRVTFDSNQSQGGTGPDRGGIAFGALFTFNSTLTVQDSTFTNNQAFAGSSSGSGSCLVGLTADALGGGIGIEWGTVVLQRVTVTNNRVVGGNAGTTAGGGFGAGIFAEDVTSLSITDSYVFGNTALGGTGVDGGVGGGGGILLNNGHETITLDRVRIISNTVVSGNSTTGQGFAGAATGGGLYLWANKLPTPAVSVTNLIAADNYVAQGTSGNMSHGGGGGGIAVQGLTANITHATLAQNRLGPSLVSGQGLLVLAAPNAGAGAANVNYGIIANHTVGGAGASAVLVQEGNTITFNRVLFAGNTKNINDASGPMLPGTIIGLETIIPAPSAGFVSPGPPNYNYRILSTSPAKEQAHGSTTPVDAEGQARPYNVVADLGADEYWPTASYSVFLPLVIK